MPLNFSLGATLSKGICRGIGTILGGVLGCVVAVLAKQVDRVGNSVLVGISVFIFGKCPERYEMDVMFS